MSTIPDASAVPAPADALAAYAAQAAWPSASAARELPELLRIPLPERVALRRSGDLEADTWRTEEQEWSDHADARYRATVQRRPLGDAAAPVRVGVKDTVDVAGFATRLGLRHHRHHPRASAPVVAGLPGELAETTAKVVSTELNLGVGSGCVNPYAPHIDPGGSSTGAAVAVAANICDIALGTDVLGSVRWPAGQCGTVGLRMTHDSALLDGVFPLSPPMDALGWVTRTVADLAYLWPRLGLDRLGTQHAPVPGTRRIGVVTDAFGPYGTAGAEMRGAVEIARAHFEAAGHGATDVRIDALWALRGPAWELCARQAWDAYRLWQQWTAPRLDDTTLASLEVGARVGDDRYAWILSELEGCRRTVGSAFDAAGVDAWLLPLDPCPPPDVATVIARGSTIPTPEDDDYEQRVAYTPIASVAGLPALTLPVARDGRGAPLSVQLVGRPGTEATLVELAGDLADQVGDLGFLPS
ncbi:amidase family protein [Streptomyces caatingaensis]|uniref:Amidase n=1 Tax=Streptomyces caatingaensis TaxID=1678637 RepID=A0A0K9XAY6_9ACTN|nr:amidase [Streptomyces caatingaensis]KNB50251.1 amidase [Streptomyces caatingaensis]